MDNVYYQRFESWYNAHTHRDRVYFLLSSCAVVFLIWYFILEKPMIAKKDSYIETEKSANIQRAIFVKEEGDILTQVTKNQSLEKENEFELKQSGVKFASSTQKDEIIKQILTPRPNVTFGSWKESVAMPAPESKTNPSTNNITDTYQLIFQSDYFATMQYLQSLEKLPWCLAWDSLEYKVTNYPQATVTVSLRIINSW